MILSKKVRLYQAKYKRKNFGSQLELQGIYTIGHFQNKKRIIKMVENLYMMEF